MLELIHMSSCILDYSTNVDVLRNIVEISRKLNIDVTESMVAIRSPFCGYNLA